MGRDSPVGNDLFDTILTPADTPDPAKAAPRLLQTPANVPVGTSMSKYVRPGAWTAFLDMITKCFEAMIARRDDPNSQSKGIPIFVHTYNCPQPRNASAGPGIGPWLCRAYTTYQIPSSDWLPLTTYLINQWPQASRIRTSAPCTLSGASIPRPRTKQEH